MNKYVADFETATWIKDRTYVWAWAVCDIENEHVIYGNSIDTFFDFCKYQPTCQIYFHNLKFDGEFIIHYLLKNNFKHIEKRSECNRNTFTTLISDLGMFYQITIYFSKSHKVTIIDSLKIIPFSVEQIAKSFNLTISKLELDYNKPRKEGHILTKEEKEYIKNDTLIVAKALKVLFDENLKKMTQGSNALSDFKKMMGTSKFNHYFPQLDYDIDKDLRKAYKGGFTYLNPIYKEKDVRLGGGFGYK